MRVSIRPFILAVALPFALAGSCAAADVGAGKTKFIICAICHSAEAGKNKIGPSLFVVVGRRSGSVAGFNYSDAMENFNQAGLPKLLMLIWPIPAL